MKWGQENTYNTRKRKSEKRKKNERDRKREKERDVRKRNLPFLSNGVGAR